jgi:hypothetical protein
VPSTPQEVRDQREETARSAVERIKALALECKQLSSRSVQTYERLAEDPELRTLESQLQEAKQQAATVQAQLKPLSVVERMKRSQEQCTVQQQVHAIQSKVMEVTQRLQPVQDEACTLFEEIEGQGAQLEQVVTMVEQCLEGPVTEKVIQEFVEQEALAKAAGRSSSSQARGLRGRVTQIRVTRDESQVSVGGLLALDQVLWKPWSCLTNFGTSTGWSKMECQAKRRSHGISPPFVDFWV